MDENIPKYEPIAIVGMSCRFAGDATNPEKLWKMLSEGRSAWTEIPSSRFNLEGVYHPQNDNISTVRLPEDIQKSAASQKLTECCVQTNVRGGHFLAEDIALFDAAFFNLSAETASVGVCPK